MYFLNLGGAKCCYLFQFFSEDTKKKRFSMRILQKSIFQNLLGGVQKYREVKVLFLVASPIEILALSVGLVSAIWGIKICVCQ